MSDPTPASFAFAGPAIDRADAVRNDPAALRQAWEQARVLVLEADGQAHADADGRPLIASAAALGALAEQAIFLGLD